MIAEEQTPEVGVDDLAGVGPKTAPLFRELGINTARDLLEYLPFRYEDLRFPTPAAQLGKSGGEENAVGRVAGVKERRVRGLEIVELQMIDDSGDRFGAKWIGRNRYVYGRFYEEMRLFVRGRVERNFSDPTVLVSQYAQLAPNQEHRGQPVPVYRASKDLASRKNRAGSKEEPVASAAADAGGFPCPRVARRRSRIPFFCATPTAPFMPRIRRRKRSARAERFVFAEFLALATAAQLRRAERERDRDARALRVPSDMLERFEAELPFALTGAQRKVIREIWADMSRNVPMNRLLQGDVGSGKTLVAAAAVLLAASNGMQSALMAPTELLAWQHAGNLAPLLLPFGLGVESLFGSQSARSRSAALAKLAGGEAALAVGTHALLTEGVDFDRLGLAIIDEQHRFGVEQRARLRARKRSFHTRCNMTGDADPANALRSRSMPISIFPSSTSCRRGVRRSRPLPFGPAVWT